MNWKGLKEKLNLGTVIAAIKRYKLKVKLSYNKDLKSINMGFKGLVFFKHFKR
jgi:hypothetical protein